MNFLSFLYKRRGAVLPSSNLTTIIPTPASSLMRLDGFSCKHCGAGIYDDRTDCLVCKMSYPSRVLEVALWHREAKRELVKKMSHDDAAHVLKEATARIAKDSKLPLKEICLSFETQK